MRPACQFDEPKPEIKPEPKRISDNELKSMLSRYTLIYVQKKTGEPKERLSALKKLMLVEKKQEILQRVPKKRPTRQEMRFEKLSTLLEDYNEKNGTNYVPKV